MLKLFEAKTPIGSFFINCKNKDIALELFRNRFTILEVKIEEITKNYWIASGETIMSILGHSFNKELN